MLGFRPKGSFLSPTLSPDQVASNLAIHADASIL